MRESAGLPVSSGGAARVLGAALHQTFAADAEFTVADQRLQVHPVALRQRLWPLVEMLRRAQAAGEPVVWGV